MDTHISLPLTSRWTLRRLNASQIPWWGLKSVFGSPVPSKLSQSFSRFTCYRFYKQKLSKLCWVGFSKNETWFQHLRCIYKCQMNWFYYLIPLLPVPGPLIVEEQTCHYCLNAKPFSPMNPRHFEHSFKTSNTRNPLTNLGKLSVVWFLCEWGCSNLYSLKMYLEITDVIFSHNFFSNNTQHTSCRCCSISASWHGLF